MLSETLDVRRPQKPNQQAARLRHEINMRLHDGRNLHRKNKVEAVPAAEPPNHLWFNDHRPAAAEHRGFIAASDVTYYCLYSFRSSSISW